MMTGLPREGTLTLPPCFCKENRTADPAKPKMRGRHTKRQLLRQRKIKRVPGRDGTDGHRDSAGSGFRREDAGKAKSEAGRPIYESRSRDEDVYWNIRNILKEAQEAYRINGVDCRTSDLFDPRRLRGDEADGLYQVGDERTLCFSGQSGSRRQARRCR